MAKGKYHEWIEPEGLAKLEAWARDGLTDEQIASNIGIAPKTLYRWQDRFGQIRQALKVGKEVVDIQVENALLKRALGYRYEEVTREYGEVTRVVTKEVQPDTTAQIFWLKNRRPAAWRDRRETELSGEVKTTNPFEGITTADIEKLVKGLEAGGNE